MEKDSVKTRFPGKEISMIESRSPIHWLALMVVVVSLAATAASARTAVEFGDLSKNSQGEANAVANPDWIIGFSFTVNQDIDVTHLGFSDYGKDGLLSPHDVGIFRKDGNTWLTDVQAQVGSGDALEGNFRFTSLVTSVKLLTGVQYRISATSGLDKYTWNPLDFNPDPAINFGGAASLFSPALTSPTFADAAVVGLFGPNFKFRSTDDTPPLNPVPEPSSLAALGMGITGLLSAWRRRK
ncbi:MAG: PEP-CTERM sorting domain-containing protein [Armatimonadetes bacterium]|nr:PEP-CTERM sorting domain-containing protein [Armatimonadota bacterium]